MLKEAQIESAISAFSECMYEFDIFKDSVASYFTKSPTLKPVIHSIKSRLKDTDHLREKILRKWDECGPIDGANIFQKITDLSGVRVLHLYQDQFSSIHPEIIRKVAANDWVLHENPVAYTWDPESEVFFSGIGLAVERKESFYTSIHYVIRPRIDSPISCEIQVRTLFEEIWGEVDHSLNYPMKSENKSCREQLLVLAKLVGAGSRLADSIYRSSN
ncbi:MAG: RelA/SpoT domain-containing protein [Deltaproteobacteria bacterium]|jgi:putative GTP pyrophosphokinase